MESGRYRRISDCPMAFYAATKPAIKVLTRIIRPWMLSTMNEVSSTTNTSGQEAPAIDSQESIGASSVSYETISVVSAIGNGALTRVESLLEAIVDAVIAGNEISIPYRSASLSRPGAMPAAEALSQPHGARRSVRWAADVRFPGRTIQEAKRFEALLCILELSRQALVSGSLITKRNIYYQNPDLFGSQAAVDLMVDNLALTLGVGRGDLNIVATAKGLISGPMMLINRDGSAIDCGLSHNTGMLLPSINEVRSIGFHAVQWVLVIEKEATFRTLAAAQYAKSSQAGHGVLITAKGYPDLATRKFLSVLQSMRPKVAIFGLVDFDPDGISILRTYQNGSRRLEHENEATVHSLRWLGVRSCDLLSSEEIPGFQDEEDQESQPAAGQAFSQFHEDSGGEPLTKRPRLSTTQNPSETVSLLSLRDRRKAGNILRAIWSVEEPPKDEKEHAEELQRMLMLNIKAEIQAVDNYGDLSTWLDDKLCVGMGADQ
ncbi:putative meiosis-specific topoisomerase [Triangularia verruculosa]|uniref:DNA topoisomerase (ATP-hydrolyzing) n=1 Tax=Triangularia verruculosa TaxID=2587418 RepID=A0AAN7AXF2_9PEZI|nr:putative meiosis-specific topoisomerase [Triangularia verruculosa]